MESFVSPLPMRLTVGIVAEGAIVYVDIVAFEGDVSSMIIGA